MKYEVGQLVKINVPEFKIHHAVGEILRVNLSGYTVLVGNQNWSVSEDDIEPIVTLTGDMCLASNSLPVNVRGPVSISEWQTEVHELAKEKGWYNPPKSDLEVMALIHSEISEAVEELRSKEEKPYLYQLQDMEGREEKFPVLPDHRLWDPALKPEGLASELADAVLRILDYCEWKGINLEEAIKLKHAFNRTRAYRHGKKL